jgi:hypothetical protein
MLDDLIFMIVGEMFLEPMMRAVGRGARRSRRAFGGIRRRLRDTPHDV